MSNLGIHKPVLEPPHWRRKVRDFLYYLADKLQEVASTVPAITGGSSGSIADNSVMRADGTGGDMQGSLAALSDSGDFTLTASASGSISMVSSGVGQEARFNLTSSSGTWRIYTNEDGGAYVIRDVTGGKEPFVILPGAPNNTIYVNASGDIGMGTGAIDERLHLQDSSANSDVLVKVENDAAAWTVGIQGSDSDKWVLTDGTVDAIKVAVTTGNIEVSGTVDGRDLAADGTKLDGIESSATADQTGAEIKTAYEGEADTNAFTDADHTKLDGIETAADVTDATNVAAAGAVMEGGGTLTEDAVPVADASGDLIDGTLVDDGTYITGLINTVSLQLSSDEVTLPTHTKPGIWSIIMEPETGTTDNCQDINGVVVGDVILVRTKDVGDQITFKDNTGGGNLRHHMIGSVDLTLTIIPARIGYHCRSTGALDMFLESQP